MIQLYGARTFRAGKRSKVGSVLVCDLKERDLSLLTLYSPADQTPPSSFITVISGETGRIYIGVMHVRWYDICRLSRDKWHVTQVISGPVDCAGRESSPRATSFLQPAPVPRHHPPSKRRPLWREPCRSSPTDSRCELPKTANFRPNDSETPCMFRSLIRWVIAPFRPCTAQRCRMYCAGAQGLFERHLRTLSYKR
jgi:hypothetical protein